ncbi:hypothetical protein J2T13_001958 [Paenibacillus sp. DS2015]
MKLIWLAIFVFIIVLVLLLSVRSRTRKPSGNVIKFQKRDSKRGLQRCTYCRKNSKLTFYASDNGMVVGVCKACKPKAESRDMLPI